MVAVAFILTSTHTLIVNHLLEQYACQQQCKCKRGFSTNYNYNSTLGQGETHNKHKEDKVDNCCMSESDSSVLNKKHSFGDLAAPLDLIYFFCYFPLDDFSGDFKI
jgi:hypothetical protein